MPAARQRVRDCTPSPTDRTPLLRRAHVHVRPSLLWSSQSSPPKLPEWSWAVALERVNPEEADDAGY